MDSCFGPLQGFLNALVYGLNQKIGLLSFPKGDNDFKSPYSEDTARMIDEEVRELAEEAENNCRKILQDNLDQLHIVAKGLLEYETLSGDEIKDLIKGIKPSRDELDDDRDAPVSKAPSVPKTGGSAAAPAN